MITKISNEVIAEFARSSSYKERFIAEYIQLKQRLEKLKVFNTKIRAAKLTRGMDNGVDEPLHDCPDRLLCDQQRVMGEYLHILEVRAVIEDIDLQKAIEDLARESIRRASECRAVDLERDAREISRGREAKPCCKSEKTSPCEEGIYNSPAEKIILSLDETIKSLEICAESGGCKGCAFCDENEYCTDTGDYLALKKCALYYLKKICRS